MEKISVVIASYNRFKYLLNTIESIKNQTYQNIEIIVVNDKSTQQEYYEYDWKDVKIIHLEKNSREIFGFACAGFVRNQGIAIAEGKYVAFCDDDDIWFPLKLERQLEEMKKTNSKMSCTNALKGNGIYNKNNKNVLFFVDKFSTNIWDQNFIKNSNSVICSSVIIEKDIMERINKFPEIDIKKYEDYDCWKIAMKETNCVYINENLVYYDMNHGDGQNY
jgi:glycosyltransferase involved in cell wall biosynthesis